MFFCDHEQACGPMVHIIEVIEEKKMFLTVIMGIMVMEAHIFQKYYCIHSHSNDCSQGLYDIHTTHFVLWGTARNIFFQMVISLLKNKAETRYIDRSTQSSWLHCKQFHSYTLSALLDHISQLALLLLT